MRLGWPRTLRFCNTGFQYKRNYKKKLKSGRLSSWMTIVVRGCGHKNYSFFHYSSFAVWLSLYHFRFIHFEIEYRYFLFYFYGNQIKPWRLPWPWPKVFLRLPCIEYFPSSKSYIYIVVLVCTIRCKSGLMASLRRCMLVFRISLQKETLVAYKLNYI